MFDKVFKKISSSEIWSTFYFFGLKKERYLFIENIAALLSAGPGVKGALYSVWEETRSFRFKKIIWAVYKDVEEGVSLSKALRKYHLLPEHMLALVETGEQSGRLTENLQIAVIQNDKEFLFRSRLKSSVLYAGIIFTLSIVVLIGMAWFVLPKISSFFSNLNTELPPITRALIKIGEIFVCVFTSVKFFFLCDKFIHIDIQKWRDFQLVFLINSH